MSIVDFIFGNKRAMIGGVTVDASINETHTMTSVCTENPVETGVTITDHVNFKPVTLSITGVITDTPVTFSVYDSVMGLVNTVASVFGKKSRSIEAFGDIEKIMRKREPIKVVTGLKVYENMICESFVVNREAKIGKAINFTATFKQIVYAVAKGAGAISASNAADSVQDMVSETADKGSQVVSKASDGLPFGNSVVGSAVSTGAEGVFAIFAGLA